MKNATKWRSPQEFGEPTWRYRALLQMLTKVEQGTQIDAEEMVTIYVDFITSLHAGVACSALRKETVFIFRQFSTLVRQYRKKGLKADIGMLFDSKDFSLSAQQRLQLANIELNVIAGKISSLLCS